MTQRIYLDNNASTAVDPKVIARIVEVLPKIQGNPSSTHSFGREARTIVQGAREAIAAYLKVKPAEIYFTSGGTEGAHIALQTLYTQGHIITSEIEHPCIYKKMQGNVTFVKPGKDGVIDPEAVRGALRPDTKLIAIMAVNNETGVKNDIKSIAEIASSAGVPFLVDAVAALGKMPLEMYPGVSAMTFSGHKIHAPAGIGFLVLRGTKMRKEHQGTENLLGIAALHTAVELLGDVAEMEILRNHFESTLRGMIPNIIVNGTGPRVGNVSNICFPAVDGETLLIGLDRAGVAASHGSACSSGALEPSRVLQALGMPLDMVRSSIRFSLSRFTTKSEIDRACAIIRSLT